MAKWMWVVAALALGLAGCAGDRQFGAYDWSTHMWRTSHGPMAEDRVSRKLIDPDTAIKREYRGEIYYFENEFDVAMFERDPGNYYYHGYEPSYAGGP